MLVLMMSCSMENDDKEKTSVNHECVSKFGFSELCIAMHRAMTDEHQQFLCMSTTCHKNYYPLCYAQKSQVRTTKPYRA